MINMFPNLYSLVQITLWMVLLCYHHALATSCLVKPSEYGYHDKSVTRSERDSANCKIYSTQPQYTYCNGINLRLTDSDYGSEESLSNDYYVWSSQSSDSQLLFIFPTRVNLTTITLHYYSDKLRGLPRLRFYAVPDLFDVWEAPAAIYQHKDIVEQQDRQQMHQRSVSRFQLNFMTRKVLMYKYRFEFSFALGEVEFFKCNGSTSEATTSTQLRNETPTNTSTTGEQRQTLNGNILRKNGSGTDQADYTTSFQVDTGVSRHLDKMMISLAVGVSLTALILIVGILVLAALLLLWQKKRTKKQKMEPNPEQHGIYSTLDRGLKVKELASNEVYDQIQLSPSTGQSEPMCGQVINEGVKEFAYSELDQTKPDKSDQGFATYAIVDKNKKKMSVQQKDGSRLSHENINTVEHDKVDNLKHEQSKEKGNLEEMYAVVQKKAKKFDQQESDAPPVPLHTIESLYSVVQKKT